jgi:hypothetical protein
MFKNRIFTIKKHNLHNNVIIQWMDSCIPKEEEEEYSSKQDDQDWTTSGSQSAVKMIF